MSRQILSKVRARVMGRLHRAPDYRHKRNVIEVAIDFVTANNIVGDYLEFGVFQGESFKHVFHYWEWRRKAYRPNSSLDDEGVLSFEPRYYAFDSFEGLPLVEQSALPIHWRGLRAMACGSDQFLANLVAARVDLERVITVPGFFDRSLTDECRVKHRLSAGAIFHIDCDLYESTVEALKFISPLIVDGSVIIFDDWFYYKGHPERGEQGAFRAWLKSNPHLIASELCTVYPASAWIINQAIRGPG